MNDKIEYIMTDEIAFKLGKFDFKSFYQFATWKLNKEPFPLLHFFDWSFPGGLGGTPCKQVAGEYVTDWENMTIGGVLKTEMIKDISHKLNYIRGRLTSYSVVIEKNKIYVGYANSYAFRDFLAQCLDDVIMDKFILLPQREGQFGRSFANNAPKYKITKSETFGTCPATPYLELEADEEIVKYIVGEKTN